MNGSPPGHTHRRRRFALTVASWALAFCLAAGARAEPALAAGKAAAVADPRGVPVQRTYVFEEAHGERTPYAIFVPTGYDAAKPAPLVVLLHGLLSNPWQVIHYQGIVAEAEKRGYLVVAPAGYNETGWYGSKGPGKDFALGAFRRPDLPDNLGELSEKDVLNVLALTCKQYSIDPRRVYLMGHSMGGGGTLYLGMKYRERWAALAPLAPAIYSSPDALADSRTLPMIVVQGENDYLVNAWTTRRWVEKMSELKMDYRYIEIPGGDHLFSIAANPGMIAEVFDFFDHHAKK